MIPEGMFKSHGTKICLLHANFKSREMFILETERCTVVISCSGAAGRWRRAQCMFMNTGTGCIPAQATDT